jgi:hypothetical protein
VRYRTLSWRHIAPNNISTSKPCILPQDSDLQYATKPAFQNPFLAISSQQIMTTNPLPIRLAQAIGLTTSTLFTGLSLTHSLVLIPTILHAPTPLLLQQWRDAFSAGKFSAPPLFLSSALSYFYLAYQAASATGFGIGRLSKGDAKLYALFGALAAGILPFTWGVVEGTNRRLLSFDDEVNGKGRLLEASAEGEARGLVERWARLNLWRSAMMGVAALGGTWMALT